MTSNTISEDDLYRTTSQYRLWSFSPEALASRRRGTHELALQRAWQHAPTSDGASDGAARGSSVDCLTVGEELRLVQRYCNQIRTTSDHFQWPVQVKATAVQYLRRFYLSNSCLTYPPKDIYKTVLFLACKTEATHMTLSEYARRISTDPDAVLAPEYKVMQALRFTLDVRQPYRGLKGVLMELLNMANGMVGEVIDAETRGAKELQASLLDLAKPSSDAKTPWKAPATGSVDVKHLTDRINAAYSAARTILDGPALLTDAYFLYTPSQILLAALQLADEPLSSFYLTTKLPISSDVRPKILATISTCADLLFSFSDAVIISKEERARLEEKLELCRDPSTRDLVQAHAAAMRGSDEDDEAKARKRKAAREKSRQEGEDLFGPRLNGVGAGGG
ncbi:hypothetical protein BAUCODRAFT_435154 [Baudoinia panamericana UAMH 10762]|uniref:RNA polymerase II holoenzyme cyclin-like subunit n=1 Tax=Baudoinia panamericana (strain UAMH 10762) TaxID=717646 RepID=M2MZH1_BAUPA|nr:uncharacterized protein BAUCODRAFT_435154 [Baudoinia panamericana UAMH 10762]EMC96993.1 hypothetical protein BAUCODRAFT_435154 [Baudoinia panamericana UAMH 10762]